MSPTGNNIFDALLAGAAAFAITWALFFATRLFAVPADRFYAERRRADKAEAHIAESLTPRIDLFLDNAGHGVQEFRTGHPLPGAPAFPEKWVQFAVRCGSAAPLNDCEAWLVSMERLLPDGREEQILQEHETCRWSGRDEKRVLIPPDGFVQRGNLFSIRQGVPLALQTWPQRYDLSQRVLPGKYRIGVTVSAEGVRPVRRSFILEWKGYDDISMKYA